MEQRPREQESLVVEIPFEQTLLEKTLGTVSFSGDGDETEVAITLKDIETKLSSFFAHANLTRQEKAILGATSLTLSKLCLQRGLLPRELAELASFHPLASLGILAQYHSHQASTPAELPKVTP
ncbi:hypothetical protein HDU85_005173 [Gaertneriomyces sp. JEL0708]|nr:hypothetical protein HDU85_005173 [Gaertneriomyces sp. JEL0708]